MFRKLLNRYVALGALAALVITGCTKAFLTDLTQSRVNLVAPTNGVLVEDRTLTFMWNEVEGATEYQFQVGRPSFDSLQVVLIDSTVSANRYTYTLNPGRYEWRVRAVNSEYESPYTVYTLTIDSSDNLSGAQVVLSSPGDSLFTNNAFPTFSWEPIVGVGFYGYRIVRGTNFDGGELFTSKIETPNTSITLSKALENGQFTWGVNAENNTSKTTYNTRFIWYDDVVPSTATLSSPQDNTTANTGNVTFQWTLPADNGTPVTDTLFLYSDPGLTALVLQVPGLNNSYSDSLATGDYYWRVRTYDRAGNVGSYTQSRKLIIP